MIGILLNDASYEQDIRELLMAFYPGEGFAHERTGGVDFYVEGTYEPESGTFSLDILENEEKKAGAAFPVSYENRLEAKTAIKRELYGLLSARTGKTLPWGTLTGIRPTKIALSRLDQGVPEEEIREFMEKTYLTSNGKIDLSLEIAEREKELLSHIDYENGYSLYVGIPFCPSICLYCSFSSSPLSVWKSRVDDYLDALCREIEQTAHIWREKQLDTVYIGGGTPTTLEPYQLERLLDKLEECFDLAHVKEFTVEAGRPDSITAKKLQVLKDHPVTRISINPQTMNDRTLEIIGRRHTVQQTTEAFALARRIGFDNINMDLIVGLPGEGYAEVEHTMRQVTALAPDSITVHSLALKRATRLNLFKDQYAPMSFVNNQEIMDMTARYAAQAGQFPYYLYRQKNMAGNFENVGYAREGAAGIYNILIMEEKQSILALGAGASTKLVNGERIERVENVKDIRSYIERIDEMIDRKIKAL